LAMTKRLGGCAIKGGGREGRAKSGVRRAKKESTNREIAARNYLKQSNTSTVTRQGDKRERKRRDVSGRE